MELDIFLREQNIRRYRRLLDSSTGPTERQTIFKLLADEMEKLKSEHHQRIDDQLARLDRSNMPVAR